MTHDLTVGFRFKIDTSVNGKCEYISAIKLLSTIANLQFMSESHSGIFRK